MLRTRENSDVFNTIDEIYLVFTSKKVNILYIFHLVRQPQINNRIVIINFADNNAFV